MRILHVDVNHPVLHETLESAGFRCDLFWDRPTEELRRILPEYEAVVIRSRFRLDRDLLEKCGRLRCIGRVGAGMENIDVAYAGQKGIICLCVPEGNRDAVGEHAVGMLLMLLNHLKRADSEVRQGIWRRAENRGSEIAGKTVGLIGYGNMGSALAAKLSGFGCRILAYDKYRGSFAGNGVEESTMDELFEACDIVSLHVPLTAETRYMVNRQFLEQFRKEIYFINTARGQCVNTADLVAMLESGRVKGACLDVLEYETISFENVDLTPAPLRFLLESDKVILSPHIAGWTHESNYKMSEAVALKMIRALRS